MGKNHKLRCSKDDPQFNCQVGTCNLSSVTKYEFNEHLKAIHTVSPSKLHSCSECDFETESKTSLRKHLRKHTSRRKFKCERCKRKFLNKEKYEHHVADHKTYVYKIYKCTICEKTYKTKQYMREYQKSHMFGPHSPLQMWSM